MTEAGVTGDHTPAAAARLPHTATPSPQAAPKTYLPHSAPAYLQNPADTSPAPYMTLAGRSGVLTHLVAAAELLQHGAELVTVQPALMAS